MDCNVKQFHKIVRTDYMHLIPTPYRFQNHNIHFEQLMRSDERRREKQDRKNRAWLKVPFASK